MVRQIGRTHNGWLESVYFGVGCSLDVSGVVVLILIRVK